MYLFKSNVPCLVHFHPFCPPICPIPRPLHTFLLGKSGLFNRFVSAEAVVDKTENPRGCVLREGEALLALLDRHVGVSQDGGRDEDDGAGRKTYDKAEIPENEMSASVRVKIAKRSDGAPAPCQICKVKVGQGDGGRAEVHGRCRKDGGERIKVAGERFVPVVE